MKISILFLTIGLCLLWVSSSFAGTETLSTYYPAPMGNYKKLSSSGMTLTPATQNAIETMYSCSNEAGNTPCPAGILYYDTTSNLVYVSNGSQWIPLGGSSANNLTIGGYSVPEIDVTNLSPGSNGYTNTTGTSNSLFNNWVDLNSPNTSSLAYSNLTNRLIQPPNDSTGINSVYPGNNQSVPRVQIDAGNVTSIQINTQYIPKGTYLLNWSATVNIDQFVNIYRIDYKDKVDHCPNDTALTNCTWIPSITNASDIPFIMLARSLISTPAEPVTFYLEQGGTVIDRSDLITDTGDLQMASYESEQTLGADFNPPTDASGENPTLTPGIPAASTALWSDDPSVADTFTTFNLNRTYSTVYPAGGNSPNWRTYRIDFEKTAQGNKSFSWTDSNGNKYTFYYNIPVMIQVLNLTLQVQYQQS